MAYNPAQGGLGTGSASSAFTFDEAQFAAAHPADSSHSASVVVPDAELLFRGHFARHGSDLILTGSDGYRHTVPGYFNDAHHHPTLLAPNGARLTPEVIDLLAGVRAPTHYAQIQAPQAQPAEAIGKVEKVVGIVNVVRNGVAVALHVGDAVYKTDVVETAADASCGISFPDGSALNIIANSRLALNDYAYDPNSTSNAALFTLVEGTFAFVAGKVAHTGDMRIATPVATMGIRGTTGVIGTSNLGEVYFVLQDDYHTDHHGTLEIIDFNIFINNTTTATYCSTTGCRTEPLTTNQINQFQLLTDGLGQIINMLNNPNPQLGPTPDSPTLPQFNTPHVLLENGNGPSNPTNLVEGNLTPITTVVVIINTGQPPPQGAPLIASSTVIWTSPVSGPWTTSSNWNVDSVPTQTNNVEVFNTADQPLTVTISKPEIVDNLTIGPGVVVDIVSGGSLTVLGTLTDEGTIIVEDPSVTTLTLSGPTTIASEAKIVAIGSAAAISIAGSTTLTNDGTIAACDQGSISIDVNTLINGSATNSAALIDAGRGGNVTITEEASGSQNFGTMLARDGGIIVVDHLGGATNEATGVLKAADHGTFIDNGNESLVNDGLVEAVRFGTFIFNLAGVEPDGPGGNFGTMRAVGGGHFIVTGDGDSVFSNEGTIESDGCGSTFDVSGLYVINAAQICAADGGELRFSQVLLDNGSGAKIVAKDATVDFTDVTVIQDVDAVIGAHGFDATVNLADTTVTGGTLATDCGGLIQTVCGTSTFDGLTIACDSDVAVGTDTTLIMSGGTIQFGGTFTVASFGVLQVEGAGATFDGTNVVNDGGICVDASTIAATLTFDGGANLTGGALTVGDSGAIDVVGCGATFGDVNVNLGTGGQIEVGTPTTTGTIFTIDDNVTITGGVLTIDAGNEVAVEESTGAALYGVDVVNNGTFVVDTGFTALKLDDATFTGGEFSIGGSGLVGMAGNNVFNDVSVDISAGGILDVGSITAAGPSIGVTLTLQGGSFSGTGTLINFATLLGFGTVDAGLTFENFGVTNADVGGQTLVIDTGHKVINTDVFEASNGGHLLINDVVNAGAADRVIIDGGTVEFNSPETNVQVQFVNGDAPTYGALVVDDPAQFTQAEIFGFAGTGASATSSDEILLSDFGIANLKDTLSFNGKTDITTVSITSSMSSISLKFSGDYVGKLTIEGSGAANVAIFDPPSTTLQTSSVSVGNDGNDTFTFHPNVSAGGTSSLDPLSDLNTGSHDQSMTELAQLMSSSANDITIAANHGDGVSVSNPPPNHFQTHVDHFGHFIL